MMGQFGENLESNIGALLKPSEPGWEQIQKTLELLPGVDVAIKVVAAGRGWLVDPDKVDRVKPVLLGLYERIAKLEADAKEYIRKPEARAIIEDALARIGDQPDEARRQEMERVLFMILDNPQDLAENRLFLRLADELPVPALKLLNATEGKVAPMVSTQKGLCQLTDLSEYDATSWLKFLAGQGLIDEEKLGIVHHTTYQAVLTPLGRLFEEYRRG
jgi:hypothetical protein